VGVKKMKVYIAIDGDGVGTRLGELVSTGANDQTIRKFAQGVADEMASFAKKAEKLGAFIILCSGDSVLLSVEGGNVSKVLKGLKETNLTTYSGGVGRTAKEAALMLQYAKLNGKNQTWHFKKRKPLNLWFRIESPLRVLSKYAAGHF
jgi:hypothetical protein